MIRQAYGSSNAEFITCNKTSIILTYRRKGTRNDAAPPAYQGQGRHTQRFRSRDLFCLFLKKGNHMRNLNTEELKQVYGGGGGSCASASKIKFFFSSRRRHTRLVSDWSSDVCSSD